ncbi:tyrosine-protein phosphatase non-receptor type 5-like [Corticium candelabrum]|uniref:tyrosine-protein phosphatase non-receptor type 5-like n=1 Tax=Corticium candelabrum TaxID=121492 RepID=UPI002E2686BA|nr:tyrosine-protein phosphatase non-receptor type 5-like [Corticium candelabrum]XP_062513236.1 tyrosine-protein phosphatase non-receptor type 5-like [Corticium candelabrum]
MTLTRKDSQGKDDGVLLDSSSPCPHVQSIMAVTDEQPVISSRLEVTESIDSQHPELLDIPSDFKRSHSVHLTGINHVLLREKPRMLSRPRLSLSLNLTSSLHPKRSRTSLGFASGMSSESDCDDDQESQRQLLCKGSRQMFPEELRLCLMSVSMIHSEFWGVPFNHETVPVCGIGPKNRYRSILPNLHSRVMLSQIDNDPSSSYINANYIRGFHEQPEQYIATQGPLANTIHDFWRMILMSRSPVIVMLTNLNEKNKSKCSPYLPTVGEITSRDISILVTDSEQSDGYLVTQLELRQKDVKHNVCHFWYNSWPDHGIPQSPSPLLCMLEQVAKCRMSSPSAPVVVHCSAGIGRTGCFISIDIAIQQLKEDGYVDVLKILCRLRQDRGGMVQTCEQYEFIHRALLLYEQELEKRRTEGTESLLPFFSE